MKSTQPLLTTFLTAITVTLAGCFSETEPPQSLSEDTVPEDSSENVQTQAQGLTALPVPISGLTYLGNFHVSFSTYVSLCAKFVSNSRVETDNCRSVSSQQWAIYHETTLDTYSVCVPNTLVLGTDPKTGNPYYAANCWYAASLSSSANGSRLIVPSYILAEKIAGKWTAGLNAVGYLKKVPGVGGFYWKEGLDRNLVVTRTSLDGHLEFRPKATNATDARAQLFGMY